MNFTSSLKIAVLDRGFVYVGLCTATPDALTITDAYCIRRWGTQNGLGELAVSGPQTATKLDRTGTVRAPMTSVMHLIDANADAWPQFTYAGSEL